MTNQEILEKAIRKAIDGGWNLGELYLSALTGEMPDSFLHGFQACIIFNHDFAKALWGERIERDLTDEERREEFSYMSNPFAVKCIVSKGWQYHLQQMVIADDPIKYLEDNL